MIARVTRWGNSLAVRIPSAFAKELQVEDGAPIDISVEDGALVVRPQQDDDAFDLDAALVAINESNRHAEIQTGPAVGQEF